MAVLIVLGITTLIFLILNGCIYLSSRRPRPPIRKMIRNAWGPLLISYILCGLTTLLIIYMITLRQGEATGAKYYQEVARITRIREHADHFTITAEDGSTCMVKKVGLTTNNMAQFIGTNLACVRYEITYRYKCFYATHMMKVLAIGDNKNCVMLESYDFWQ